MTVAILTFGVTMSAIDKLELSKLLAKLENKSLDFASVLAIIDRYYDYRPT